jgi:hypothetical protein
MNVTIVGTGKMARGLGAGPLGRARELEAVGLLHMGVQETLGTGYASALKVVG